MHLNKNLLESSEFYDGDWPIGEGTLIRGLYNPSRFFIRLRNDQHKLLNTETTGNIKVNDNDTLQAYSTLLHETIHWWQHIGSNYGFLSSLSFPLGMHASINNFRKLISNNEAYKSILDYANKIIEDTGEEKNENVNVILNNWFDIQYAGILAFNAPSNIKWVIKQPLFLSAQHSYHMMWGYCVDSLSHQFDPENKFLANAEDWITPFDNSLNEGLEKHSITVAPLGTKETFEGQARFCQLQFLHYALNLGLSFEDFEAANLLSGVYVKAFHNFLESIGEERPASFDSPLVGLFLLVCDLAINPSSGFPLAIRDYDLFRFHNDPGFRFITFCSIIKNKPELKVMISKHSKEEYIQVTTILCSETSEPSPLEVLERVVNWADTNPLLIELMEEEFNHLYKNINMPIRLLFAKYIAFQKEKLQKPEFFCWSGVCMAKALTNSKLSHYDDLFEKHKCLFIDRIDGIIYPARFKAFDEKATKDTFNQFFQWNIGYDLARQWITKSGKFNYNYDWLTTQYEPDEIKEWAEKIFKMFFGMHPDEIKILPN